MLVSISKTQRDQVYTEDTAIALIHTLMDVPEPVCVVDANLSVYQSNASARRALNISESRPIDRRIKQQLGTVHTMNSGKPWEEAKHVLRADDTQYRIQFAKLPSKRPELILLKFIALDDARADMPAIETNYQLTAKEVQVARLVQAGLSNACIAGKLFVSTNTIKSHLKNIHAKLGSSSRAELVARLNPGATLQLS